MDLGAERNLEELKHLLGDGSGACNHSAYSAAKDGLELVEDNLVINGVGCLAIVLEIVKLLLDAPFNDLALHASGLIDLLLHDVVESIVQAGDRGHNRGLKDNQIVFELHYIALEEAILHGVPH